MHTQNTIIYVKTIPKVSLEFSLALTFRQQHGPGVDGAS